MTIPDPACRRATGRGHRCGYRLSEHTGEALQCPGPILTRSGAPRVFKRYEASTSRASYSFNHPDALALGALVTILLSGGDTRAWSRRNAGTLGRLARMTKALRARIAAQQAAYVPAWSLNDNQCDRVLAGVRCRARRSEHVGEELACPRGGPGQTFKPHYRQQRLREPVTGARARAGQEAGQGAESASEAAEE